MSDCRVQVFLYRFHTLAAGILRGADGLGACAGAAAWKMGPRRKKVIPGSADGAAALYAAILCAAEPGAAALYAGILCAAGAIAAPAVTPTRSK